jgi:hypothetical protein
MHAQNHKLPEDEVRPNALRQWHAPQFYVLEVASTAGPLGGKSDNPGHEGTHS